MLGSFPLAECIHEIIRSSAYGCWYITGLVSMCVHRVVFAILVFVSNAVDIKFLRTLN